jgi:hypothetical protein
VSGYVAAAQTVVNTVGGAVKLLDKNNPSVSANHVCATAMPHDMDPMSSPAAGTNSWTRWYVQAWDFAGESYHSQCKLNFSFAYGATYHGGGAFITSVSAWVSDISVPEMWVPWPQHLDVTFVTDGPHTEDVGGGKIVAFLPFQVQFEESTPMDNAPNVWRYILKGDGSKVMEA